MAKAAASTASSEQRTAAPRRRGAWRFLPIALIAAGLAAASALGWTQALSLASLADSRDMLQALVAAHPLAAPLGYVAVYAAAVAFSFPAASVLTIIGGFLFGWALGAALAVVAATVGATALFAAARTAFGEGLKERLSGLSAKLAEGFEQDAFAFLLVLRLAPFIPFVAVNIAPALFHVRLKTFVAATAIGIVPGAIAYSWLGEGLGSVLAAAAAAGRDVKLKDLVTPEITVAFALLSLVALVAAIVKRRWGNGATGDGSAGR